MSFRYYACAAANAAIVGTAGTMVALRRGNIARLLTIVRRLRPV